MFKYTIPAIPPSMNTYKGRKAEWQYRQDKCDWEWRVWGACRNNLPPHPLAGCTVEIRYFFATERRRDVNNYDGQFITDGLVKSKVIADDNHKAIDLKISFDFDKDNPRTEIIIHEPPVTRIQIDVLDSNACIIYQDGSEIMRTGAYGAAKYIEVLLGPYSIFEDASSNR